MRSDPQYLRKKEADEVSYSWDGLINLFLKNIIGGTTVDLIGQGLGISDHELGIRQMALQSRFDRRGLSRAISDLYHSSDQRPRAFRASLGNPAYGGNQTAFAFLYLSHAAAPPGTSEEKYRLVRVTMLRGYMMKMAYTNPHIGHVVGLGLSSKGTPKELGYSEDLAYFQVQDWTPEMVAEMEEIAEHYSIMQPQTAKFYRYRDNEYPNSD